jgi:5-formyltetrahydrofolate cyclo-ligase
MPDIRAEKQALRRRMRDLVRAIPDDEAARRSADLCARLAEAPEIAGARAVLLTLALPGEADLAPLAERLLARGVTLCLPRIDWDARAMTPVRVASITEGLVAGRHGVREPSEGEPVDLDTLDAVLVPGLAFDAAGRRLGRGGGFFDRLLGELRSSGRAWLCGGAFDCQVVERVPVELHDVRMDAIATESGVVRCQPDR